MNFGIDGGLEGGVAKVVGQVTTGRLTETLVLMPGGAVEVVVVGAVALVVVFGTVVSCPGAFADDCPEGLLDWPELAR
jgi:hypothetical protein